MEESHSCSRLGGGGERDAEEHVHRNIHRRNGEVQEWKWVQIKGAGGEHIKNYGQQVMSVTTPEGFVRKSTWQLAAVRRPLVSASHIIRERLVHLEERDVRHEQEEEGEIGDQKGRQLVRT